MLDRPAVLVRVEDVDGEVGWGEAWCNFPAVGAEHRARMFDSCVAPILTERAWDSPSQLFETLVARLRVLGIQSGEPGTIAQIIAATDIAMWDLTARRQQKPLWRMLGGAGREVNVYASGLNPVEPEKLAARKHDEGYRAFKIKVGFGADRDVANLRALRDMFGPAAQLMVDANQAWDVNTTVTMSRLLAPMDPVWLEEPLSADNPLQTWQSLARDCAIPLAAGENMRGVPEFEAAGASGAFAVMQPDLGKWGGFTGCLAVAKNVLARHILFCPHWLGGGIGLLASMHLKAAVGGPGYVEVDANPNPLRDMVMSALPVREGVVALPDAPGLGLRPDMDVLKAFQVPHNY
ncbi:mandelate racemase/muconate lactonizing enzyme family protein [Allopusillimonas soli]|uniref:Mandelate racemase/muconate lactonizing enzyme family protein n=2 Tax=Allopusillimonas soli TaxID=659016 RepID=A0A853FAJ8_9BURK|nr:mandelate racemase/muconate lactonizing enzyme family protein [Allopusillimonas soli]TEA75643.1 mandelate racemase/muconate lactonizing enzyme family protein [Allopusillimonas soli]